VAEVERLMKAAQHGRYGHRDATLILVAFRHGLRAAEICDLEWSQVEFGNALFFAGDLGQRIFQQPFSWRGLGVDIRGRSRTLRVNYRTSHQIRTQADRLLGPVMTDVDGNSEDRSETVSVFNGAPPTICSFNNENAEVNAVGKWITEKVTAGVMPHEVGVFADRSTIGSCPSRGK
jgi:hypothetical protein